MKYPIQTDEIETPFALAVDLINTAYYKGLRGEKRQIETWEDFEKALIADGQSLPSGVVKRFMHVTLKAANYAYEQGRSDVQ